MKNHVHCPEKWIPKLQHGTFEITTVEFVFLFYIVELHTENGLT